MNTNKIAELNDKLRRNIFHSGKDKVVLTSGFSALPFDEHLAQQILFLYTKEFYSSKRAFKSSGRDSFILVKQ